MNIVYSYDNLNDLAWFGDKRIMDFLTEWENVIENLCIELSDDAKRDILYAKMSHSSKFAVDLAYYKREKAKSIAKGSNTEDYSLEFLISLMKAHLAEEHEESVIESRRQQVLGKVRGGRNRNDAAPATTEKTNNASPAAPATI